MQFRAKVLSSTMKVDLIEVEAASEEEARRFVESSGARILHLRAGRTGWSRKPRQKAFNLTVFNQQLHSLLEAGQTVVDAVEVLGKNDRRGRHRAIYDTLLQGLQQGNQLSDAMSVLPSVFPPLYVAMVRASETTGTVRAAINRYMQYQKQVDEIRNKLTAAATYPAILLGVGGTVIAFLMLYVLPRFSAVYDDVASAKSGPAGFVQLWGGFVRHNTELAWSMVLIAGAMVVVLVLHPAVRAAAYRKLLSTPWLGEKMWVLQLARLYRTLSMLLRSGVSVLSAMRMTQASLPAAMQADLTAAIQAVSEGKPMSVVMTEYNLSTEIAQRLLVAGESSGNLDEMMERIADFYDQETAIWIDTAGRLIEPALMIIIGLVVGGIVLMLYSPIFDLANIV
ncbi:type II secretion system F family protein [Undibacterium sp.]|jgi:general secretion pathway protein F|uniref:type II secretion system F family protein n=1 Tax=Undibacterium sp. TaxID=1914977 RepID=UPI002CCA4EB8|nr:type II secretion system F family protein [Undibacterium sp.]HTD05248.1 type II secretion system F family protein [Undibacterium sp.]